MSGSTCLGGNWRVVPPRGARNDAQERQVQLGPGGPEGHIGQAQVDEVGLAASIGTSAWFAP